MAQMERQCLHCGEKQVNPFIDVPVDSYFLESVLWAKAQNITGGTGAFTFGPNDFSTRAQAVTFLWRAAGSPEPISLSNPFTDVNEGDYFYTAVLWAVEQGVTSGVSASTFGANLECTRAQIVTFLWRAAGSPAASAEVTFSDVATTAYYYAPVAWAVEKGVTAGIGNGMFGSEQLCTRAQVVTFLYHTFAN